MLSIFCKGFDLASRMLGAKQSKSKEDATPSTSGLQGSRGLLGNICLRWQLNKEPTTLFLFFFQMQHHAKGNFSLKAVWVFYHAKVIIIMKLWLYNLRTFCFIPIWHFTTIKRKIWYLTFRNGNYQKKGKKMGTVWMQLFFWHDQFC